METHIGDLETRFAWHPVQNPTCMPIDNHSLWSNSIMANRFLGMDWAPVVIPLQRRLQMVAVVLHTASFSVLPLMLMALLFYMLVATSYWWLSLGYIMWIVYDVLVLDTSSTGGRRAEWVRKGFWYRYFRDYFPISLIKVRLATGNCTFDIITIIYKMQHCDKSNSTCVHEYRPICLAMKGSLLDL